MKNVIISLLLFASLAANGQNILRVNNIPGINAPYTTIKAAVAAASNGDIILVEGSPFPYDVCSLTITKTITLQGPGYFLNENTGLQSSQQPATITGAGYPCFVLGNGSAGSTIKGFVFNTAIAIRASNISFLNNWIAIPGNGLVNLDPSTPITNVRIAENYLFNITSGISNVTNIIVSNNYILGNINWGSPVFGFVKNNIVAGAANNISNCDVASNIFLSSAANPISNTFNSTIRNNVFVATAQANADATNLLGQTASSLFVGLSGNTTDTQWRLKAGSPAIGAGEGGIDCGIYGGVSPYKISGISLGQPTITTLNVPGNVSQSGTLNVKVSAKVN